jgi:hypothetical protein
LDVVVHPVCLKEFNLPLLDFVSDAEFTLGECLVEFFVLLDEFLVIEFEILDQVSLLLLEILVLLPLNSILSFI